MPLSETQQRKFQDWVGSKMHTDRCSACNANHWQAGELIMAPVFVPGKGTQLGGSGVPVVQLICTNCGYVMHFAAKAVGLI